MTCTMTICDQRGSRLTSTCAAQHAAARRLRPARNISMYGRLTPDAGVRLDDGSPHPPPWRGVDQERFTESSWQGGGIVEQIHRMRALSG
jgi:hypothetical protein